MTTLVEQLSTTKVRENGPLGLFRKKAREKQQELGLPTKKWETFRYMPLLKLYQSTFATREKTASEYGDIAFHNGCFIEKKHANAELMTLEEGMKKYSLFISNALNKTIAQETNPFMLLNIEKHEDGAFLYIPPNVVIEKPITITQHCEMAISFSKLHVLVGRGAQVKLHLGQALQHEESFCHLSVEATLEEGSSFSLLSESKDTHDGWYFESVRIHQKRDTKSTYYATSKGGKGTRYDAEVYLMGSGSFANILGVHELREKAQAHTQVLMRHIAPHCISNQKVKCGLFDESRSSFEGKIYVEQEAQKTEAYQLNNNLLLGEKAHAYSKPNLEIFADDVKASHGSTIGQLSDEELFYLQTRGIAKNEAENLLVNAFFKEMDQLRPW